MRARRAFGSTPDASSMGSRKFLNSDFGFAANAIMEKVNPSTSAPAAYLAWVRLNVNSPIPNRLPNENNKNTASNLFGVIFTVGFEFNKQGEKTVG